jgi:hypothetical protein
MAKPQMVSETRGIGQLLNERRYFQVPSHQRDFAWPLGAVEQYLEDIVGAMSASDSEYFLGLIVLVDTEDASANRYEILDGQQRLATTTMIYAAIRQWLRDNAMDSDAGKIQNDFIGISEIGEEEDEPRVILNINNSDLFREIVVNPCADKLLEARLVGQGRYSSNRKLIEAALLCRRCIAELAEKQGDEKKAQASVLFQLAKYLRDKVQVTCLDVSAPENAYAIFESLNDRGIDLSVLDLLKNYLLKGAGSNEAVILSNWTKMVAAIGDRRGDDFLKAFWTSRFGRIQGGRLFKELKKRYDTKSRLLELSKELATVAEVFGDLEISDSDLWKQCSHATQEQVRALSLLGAKQTHPILLAAIAKFKPEEVERLLKHLVVLIMRYQLVGRGRTGKLEIQSALVAEGISSEKYKSAKSVWERLSAILPSDDEFVDDFSRYVETKPAQARWILRELEIQKWMDENPGKSLQTTPIADADLVNLEHILPKNPNQEWKHVISDDSEILSDCLNRLGNLCLLAKPNNKTEGSGGFVKKSTNYGKSEFLLTKAIAHDYQEWTRDAIEARQRQLSKLALKRWSA